MWCSVQLVEHQEKMRAELVPAILAYTKLASFLTYRDGEGFVRYAIWFEDRHLNYVLGLHAANVGLGGVEVKPMDPPTVLENCDNVWEMELSGYGGAPIPDNTGERSPTAALGTQITDIAYRLLVCQRVKRSEVVEEWAKSGGRPHSMVGKAAGMLAHEAMDFFKSDTQAVGKQVEDKRPEIKVKPPPYTHARILLGANTNDHLAILRDSFPAGSLKRHRVVHPDKVPALAVTPVNVPHKNMTHFPVFNDAELMALEILPTRVTEVPMEYGRGITTTTQPPSRFMELHDWEDRSMPADTVALFQSDDDETGEVIRPGNIQPTTVYDEPDDVPFPVRMVSGEEPPFPVRMIRENPPQP